MLGWTRYRPMYDKGSKGVCKRCQYVMFDQCMENAHIRARYVKYTTNDPNMFLIRKHEKPQSLVFIRVQTSENYNTCYFCHKGPTSKANHQKKPIPYKNLTKIKFSQPICWKSQPRAQNSPKHNLRIKNNEKKFRITLEMLMDWKTI